MVPKKLYWRVTTENDYNNRKRSKHAFVVYVKDVPPKKLDVGAEALYSQISLNQTFKEDLPVAEDLTFSGPTASFWGEYYFRSSHNRRSLKLKASLASLSNSEAELTQRVIHMAHGWRNSVQSNSSHTYYLGYRNDGIDLTEKKGPQAKYQLNFLTGSYRYQKDLSHKVLLEFVGGVLVPLSMDVSPSLNLTPALSYHLSKEFSLRGSVGFERSYSKGNVKYSTGSSDVEFTLQQFSAGLGLVWRPWK